MEKLLINLPEIVIDILGRMDQKLIGHCERITYMTMLYAQRCGKFTNEEVCKLTWTALFHDIGLLHKVDQAPWDDSESGNKFSHSEYGYLFLKQFSPYPEYATIVRYHHAPWHMIDETDELSSDLKQVVRVIKTTDQIDLYKLKCENFNHKIDEQVIETFLKEPANSDLEAEIREISSASELTQPEVIHRSIIAKLQEIKATPAQTEAMLQTLISAIDFRSRYTAIHCSIVVKVSDKIGELAGLNSYELKTLHIGSMLHDLGKISIPLRILESQGKLYDNDWEIMKSHVTITEEILKNRVSDDILEVAIRHHETLDGTGYPKQLTGDVITKTQRITTIADIISALSEERSYKQPFSNEKILSILKEMSKNNKICGEVLNTVEENYDIIIQTAKSANREAVEIYDKMMRDYRLMKTAL